MALLNDSRFSTRFGLTTPLALAPMALAAGGALASACAHAGALGLVGGGYGDLAWTQREYRLALELAQGTGRIGCGFITWKLHEDASALDWLLDLPPAQRPRALMLSFGDPRPHAARIAAAGVPLICQVQRMAQVPQAVEAGAAVLVAQGAEAGGHGMNALDGRATFTLVPELADWLAAHAPGTLLLAAGGIADGRTLAAALVLGADGALVGTRLWATRESLAEAAGAAKQAAAPTDKPALSGAEQRKLQAAQRQQYLEQRRPLAKRQQQLEQQMDKLNVEKASLEARLCEPLDPGAIAEAGRKLKQCTDALEEAEMNWLEVSAELEAVETAYEAGTA